MVSPSNHARSEAGASPFVILSKVTKQSGEVGRHGVGVSHTQATGQRRFPRNPDCHGLAPRASPRNDRGERARRRTLRTVFARSDAGVTKQSGEAGRHGVGESHAQANGATPPPPPQIATALAYGRVLATTEARAPRLPRPRLGRVLATTEASGGGCRARRTPHSSS